MSLLTEFLKLLLSMDPRVFDSVKKALSAFVERGHMTLERKENLIREIRPTREKEIDARIDAEVAKNFPKDEDGE